MEGTDIITLIRKVNKAIDYLSFVAEEVIGINNPFNPILDRLDETQTNGFFQSNKPNIRIALFTQYLHFGHKIFAVRNDTTYEEFLFVFNPSGNPVMILKPNIYYVEFPCYIRKERAIVFTKKIEEEFNENIMPSILTREYAKWCVWLNGYSLYADAATVMIHNMSLREWLFPERQSTIKEFNTHIVDIIPKSIRT